MIEYEWEYGVMSIAWFRYPLWYIVWYFLLHLLTSVSGKLFVIRSSWKTWLYVVVVFIVFCCCCDSFFFVFCVSCVGKFCTRRTWSTFWVGFRFSFSLFLYLSYCCCLQFVHSCCRRRRRSEAKWRSGRTKRKTTNKFHSWAEQIRRVQTTAAHEPPIRTET